MPVLHFRNQPSRQDLVRLYHQTESRWSEHLAEAEVLDIGTAYSNPRLPGVHHANNIRDVALPDGMSPGDVVELVAAHYAARKTRCAYWTMNPSAPESRTRPMMEHLLASGYRAETADIMLLERPPQRSQEVAGLTIIPARASFRHVRQLFEESARLWNAPELAEAGMLHMDDPHWDALLAMKDGLAVAHIGVLGVGEVGRIDKVYVAEAYRGQGIGRTMMSRIMETCARSLFRHIMLSVLPDNRPAVALYKEFGFGTIGQITSYFAQELPT